MPKPTIQDVARAAGVHPATVSRALNPALVGRVTPATTRRVEEAAARLGYVPDEFGRTLRTRRSRMIGVVVPDLGNPVFPPIVRGIEDTLRTAGYAALIANTDDSADREEELLRTLTARRCDGFIIASSRRDDRAVVDLVNTNTPVVLVNRLLDVDAAAVSGDDAAGMVAAVDHLVALGHTAIAHVAGPVSLSMTGVRRTAFETAIEAAGLAVDPELIEHAQRYAADEGKAAFSALLDRRIPTAVIAGNDMIAVGCYAALRERGIPCPAEVSVIGFNNMPLSDFLDPALTTVAIPQYDIGARAAQLVLDLIADQPRSHVLVPVALLVRGSTGPPPVRPSRRS
ncbi:LacI family DNA-binding transcriptional regulator [Mycolicibacterium tokaiense]|uniref:LacI family transcriptional regulator n=1 Tax=Mycolicibacterium tokaiense TaxID=39695 RepID=A0A378TD52_9MYCO|nr:LacI family DNA-binding transcriptional regulator [Mycolicibacterium tokaiense]BBY86757.1 ribose operon repressor RbsR [Mycolicibacterium tokaiense]STZ58738.1 LacI family transcriptional regulator [Mycolicibacterium tokaiense]